MRRTRGNQEVASASKDDLAIKLDAGKYKKTSRSRKTVGVLNKVQNQALRMIFPGVIMKMDKTERGVKSIL